MMSHVAILTLWALPWLLPLTHVSNPHQRETYVRADSVRILEKEIIIRASLDRVWDAWTTEEGLRIVSPVSNIGLHPGGAYELFLQLPPDEQGRRGSEGSQVLTVLPRELLAFDWTFPPDVPGLRRAGAKTHVVVFFAMVEGGVRIRLRQYGWGDGPEWDAGYRYFDEAWSGVLQSMQEQLEKD